MARTRIMTTMVNGKREVVEYNKTFDHGLFREHVGKCCRTYSQTPEDAATFAQNRKATKAQKALVAHNKSITSQMYLA